jgi:hypothetical protein
VTSAGACVAESNTVRLTWQENVAVECQIKPLLNNRLYTLEGRVFAPSADVKLATYNRAPTESRIVRPNHGRRTGRRSFPDP